MKVVRYLAFSSSFALLALLTACQQGEAPAPRGTESTPNGPDARPGISASNGRLVLPVVSGRPAAVYFTVRNGGPGVATLAGVHVAGAGEAQMHRTQGGSMSKAESLDIEPGASLEFAPGGLHVMAFDLDGSLKPGEDTELTLTFSDGDKLSMPLRIESMAGDMTHDDAGMPGMKH